MIDKEEEEKTDPISQPPGRITDVNYCYRVNWATGTKLDMKRKSWQSFIATRLPERNIENSQ